MVGKWWWHWQARRIGEKLAAWVADQVPRWLCYRVYIRVVAEVTGKDPLFRSREIPAIPAIDILQSYSRREYADAR